MDAKRKAEDRADEDWAGTFKKARSLVDHWQSHQLAAPPLRRVIIPPLECDTALGKITYSGTGLILNSVPFERNISEFFEVTTGRQNASIYPRKPQHDNKWWNAQCALRGLITTGKNKVLRKRLKDAQANHSDMTHELRVLEAKLDEEFRIKNAEAHENLWEGLTSDQAKALENPERFINETYLHEDHPPDHVVVLEGDPSDELTAASERLGLVCEAVKTLPVDASHRRKQRWTVVGRSRPVLEKIQEIHDKNLLGRASAAAAKEDIVAQQHHAQVLIAAANDPAADWDVSGTWVLDCPSHPNNRGDGDRLKDQCQIIIVFDDSSRMWAYFDFIVANGVFRFGQLGEVLALEIHSDDSGDEGSDDGYYLPDNGPPMGLNPSKRLKPIADSAETNNQYPHVRPSSSNTTWNFQWRGSDGDLGGELNTDFDYQHGCISFGDPSGTILSGLYNSHYTGEIEFTGRKISASTTRAIHVDTTVGLWPSEDVVQGPPYDWAGVGSERYGLSQREDEVSAWGLAYKWAYSDKHAWAAATGDAEYYGD